MDAQHALAVWDALIESGEDYGITPAGMLALDVARIEAGLMLIDVDYVSARKALIEAQTSSESRLAGLGSAVAVTGCRPDRRCLRRRAAAARSHEQLASR